MSLAIEEKEVDRLPINIDPEIMSGTPVFEGTRVPVQALIDNLADGVSLDECGAMRLRAAHITSARR